LAHLAIGAALLAAPGVERPPKPPPFVLVEVTPPPLPIPQPTVRPEPPPAKPIPKPTRRPIPPVEADAPDEPAFAAPPPAPRAAPLKAAPAVAAPTPQTLQDAPFLADVGERAETLAPARTVAPALSSVEENSAFVGASSERMDALQPQTAVTTPRELAAALAAPEALAFSSEAPPAPTPGLDADAKKRAEDEARRKAALKAPQAAARDAPIAVGGSTAPTGAFAGGGPQSGARGGGASGGSAAIRGIVVDGLNEKVGCDNPDDVRLSDEERAACNRQRWAGAKDAARLGAVRPRDATTFNTELARKTPPKTGTPVAACKSAGAAGALDCLPDRNADQTPKAQ